MSSFSILIEEYGAGHAVAAIEKGFLVDLLIDSLNQDNRSLIGSIVSAKLHARQKGINGTFVTLPDKRRGFLKEKHNFPPHSIVPVYISVMAEQNKAQPVTLKLLLKGRSIILTPDKPGINISRKIKSKALRSNILTAISLSSLNFPEKCGLIVRSQAANVAVSEVIQEADEKISLYSSILENNFEEPRELIAPSKARNFALSEWLSNSSQLIIEGAGCFDQYGVWEQIPAFLTSRVELENGGFLLIEPTSAFVAVDINTGSDVSYAAALTTNLFAMRELPKQLEVRGLGGKIVIEFAPISKSDRFKVENNLKQALALYKSECTVVGWTKLGNLELQKKRYKHTIFEILRHDDRFYPKVS